MAVMMMKTASAAYALTFLGLGSLMWFAMTVGTHIDLLDNGEYTVERCYLFGTYDCARMYETDSLKEAENVAYSWDHPLREPQAIRRIK